MHTETLDLSPIIDSIAAEYARKFGRWGVERADLSQELYLWVWRHPKKIEEWFEDETAGTKLLARTLRNEASRCAQEWKAQAVGYSLSDLAWYAKGEVKVLLDAVFDPQAWTEPPVSEEGGRSSKAPAEGGNWQATLADVARAFDQLSEGDKTLLRLFHQDGYSNVMLAELNGITQQAQSKQHDKAIGRLHKLLGGDRPRNTHDDAEGPCECEDFVGTRRAMSNAAARATTQATYDED